MVLNQWHAGHTKNKDNSYGSCRLSYSSTCQLLITLLQNMINITCNQIVTWYGQYHFAPFDLHLRGTMIIFVTGMTPWSPSSWSLSMCHHMVVSPTIALALLLSHSDKVKQLYGACILCNKETTIRLLPVADNFRKTWSSHTTTYISSRLWPYHITTCPAKTS